MQTSERIQLKFNRPILYSGKNLRNDSGRLKDGTIMDKSIQNYRMWFLFLKLGLELDSLHSSIILKDEYKNIDGSKSEAIIKRIKVREVKYKGWDLDQVLEGHFDGWWKSHRSQFLDEGIKILRLNDSIISDPNYLFIKIDQRRRSIDTIAEIRAILRKNNRHQTQSKFQVIGNPRSAVLQNKYNALVLKINGRHTDRDILEPNNKFMRPTHVDWKGYSKRDPGRTMHDLLLGSKGSYGAKQILLSVCDGYFVKNPHTNYLD